MATPVTSNVITGYARLYTAPVGTAMPADTVALDGTWPTGWKYVGGTEEGVTFTVGTNTSDISIEEQSIPVQTVVNAKTVTVTTSLSEDTVESMLAAYGSGSIATTAAATGVIGKKVLTLSDTLNVVAVAFEAINTFGFFRRVLVPSALSTGTVGTPYRRAANNRAYPLELHAICAPNLITITDKTADALP